MKKAKRLTKDEYIDKFADLGGDISWSGAAQIAEHEFRLNTRRYGKMLRGLAAIVYLATPGQTVYSNDPEIIRFLNKAYPDIKTELIKDESSYIRPSLNI